MLRLAADWYQSCSPKRENAVATCSCFLSFFLSLLFLTCTTPHGSQHSKTQPMGAERDEGSLFDLSCHFSQCNLIPYYHL